MIHPAAACFVALALAAGDITASSPRTLTESDTGTKVELPIGDVVRVRLPAQMGTGYRWIAQPNAHVDVREAALIGTDRPGGTETQQFEVRAIAAGQAELVFEYRRSWMPEEAPAKRYAIEVIVQEASARH